MEKQLILVNSNDEIIGYNTKEICHKRDGMLHRAFSIFIFNKKNELLIQKRSTKKKLWPLYWSNSVCSHPYQDQDYLNAAFIRLKVEFGIETSLSFIYKFEYKAEYKDIGIENEMCSVFYGRSDKEIKSNPDEIEKWKFVNITKLSKDILNHSYRYTPWFLKEWSEIRKKYLPDIINQL